MTDTTHCATNFDIAIIGGGMVGASLAVALPKHFNVAVIESFAMTVHSDQPVQPSFDARATALSFSSQQFLKAIGIWENLVPMAQSINDIHVSDKGHWGSVLLSSDAESMDALGYVIENRHLGRGLLNYIQQQQHIQFYCPATVTKLVKLAQGVQLQVRKGDATVVISSRLVIVADGANSPMCQQLGIHQEIIDGGQIGITANIATDQSHQGVAYERFTNAGPMALLPLPASEAYSHRSALVWTMPKCEADALLGLADADFLKALQQCFGYRQGQFIHVGKRISYPLRLSTAKEQIRQNIVVLGNAAHSLHPVAGQGFNLALRDVNMLAAVLREADEKDQDVASLRVLQRYLKRQSKDQWLTTAFSDLLPGVFASQHDSVKIARGLGLLSLELLPALKSNFVKFSTGIRAR